MKKKGNRMNEFMNSQKSLLGISDFLQSASNYTKENFPQLNVDDLFTSAISGSISTNFWTNSILDLARTRSKTCHTTHGYCFNRYYYS